MSERVRCFPPWYGSCHESNDSLRAFENGMRPHARRLPVLGIGNAAVAAKRCGAARFIGIELHEGYLSVASNRLGSIAAKSNPLPAIAAG